MTASREPQGAQRPQVDHARDFVKGQQIDYLLLTIGGNDTGFGDTIGVRVHDE